MVVSVVYVCMSMVGIAIVYSLVGGGGIGALCGLGMDVSEYAHL